MNSPREEYFKPLKEEIRKVSGYLAANGMSNSDTESNWGRFCAACALITVIRNPNELNKKFQTAVDFLQRTTSEMREYKLEVCILDDVKRALEELRGSIAPQSTPEETQSSTQSMRP